MRAQPLRPLLNQGEPRLIVGLWRNASAANPPEFFQGNNLAFEIFRGLNTRPCKGAQGILSSYVFQGSEHLVQHQIEVDRCGLVRTRG